MADSNIAGLPAGAAIADTDLIAGSDAGSGTLVKKTGLQFNTYIRQMLAALPTSDPHVVGALWNNGGLVAISFPFVRSLAGNTGTYALTGSTATLVESGAIAFQVDFTAISVLPAQVTLTRASAGTYFDSSGILQSAAIDAPRFDHVWNGAAWVGAGLLIEESRTNLLLQSDDLPAGWSPEFLTYGTGGTSPSGTTAQRLIEGIGSSRWAWLQFVGLGSAIYTLSFYASDNGRRYVTASMGATTTRIAFDLVSGTITQNDPNASGTITSLGGGLYRCTLTSVSAVAIDYIAFGLSDTGTPSWDGYGRTVYNGAGAGAGIYFDDAQLEANAFATSYIPTTTATVTRSADVALLTGTATTALEGSAASAILEAQLFATTPAGTEVLFGKSPTAYSFVRTATTLSFFSGGADLTATFGSGNISSAFRTAISFDGGTRNIVINGGTLVSGATVAAVTGDVPLGGYASGAQIATGWYRKMAIWNNRLLDATLTAKSVPGTAF